MSNKRSPEDLTITPRDLNFDVRGAKVDHWLDGDPVATAVMNALSLSFPDGERLFMDAVRAYRGRLTGKLAEDAKNFIAQEAIHSREHHLLNNMINREKYPVSDIEKKMRDRLAFARSAGPMRMLIVTICLEHFTALLADLFAVHDEMFSKTDPALRDLWHWHAIEETEHKAVAFDVFTEASKDWASPLRWLRRSLAMIAISYDFINNITDYSTMMLEAEGYSAKDAKRAVKRFLWKEPSFFGRGWKIWVSWFKPGFHPWDHDNRALMAQWRADLVPIAAE